MSTALLEKLLNRINKQGPLPPSKPELGSCWLWTGPTTQDGYGVLTIKVADRRTSRAVHRLLYKLLGNTVPDDLELDYLCRVRSCCNPTHLEIVTHEENIRRGDHKKNHFSRQKIACPQGHPLTEGNLVVWLSKRGLRRCLICQRSHMNKWARQNRANQGTVLERVA
jgi:hypothetical protein